MRIGCCLNMAATQPDGTGMEWIDGLAACGFDYAELPLAQMMALSGEAFAVLKRRLKDAGVACAVCNNFFPGAVRLTGENVDRQQVNEYAARALDRAAELGAKIVVFGSSQAKNVPAGYPQADAWRQLVALLRAINPLAFARGIVVVIEPLCRLESNIVNTAAEGLRLMNEVGRENVQLLVDYYHLAKESEDPAIITQAGAAIRHTHIARPEGRRYPREGDGHDYRPFFAALKASGYDGGISLEAFSEDFRRDAGQAAAYVRRLAEG